MASKQSGGSGLSGNLLKLIACLSMLCDHAGLLLFPDVSWLRYVGRLAMPIFAFFIGIGCKKTHSPLKYLLRVFLLGVLCQAFYVGEDLLQNGQITELYLNVLFTFTLSMLLCFAFLRLQKASGGGKFLWSAALLAVLGGSLFLCRFASPLLPFSLRIDYGMAGILLPCFALASEDKSRQTAAFAVGLVCFNLLLEPIMPCTWFSLAALPLLWLYNGNRGKGGKAAQWGFYLFYPLHFALLFGISLLMP